MFPSPRRSFRADWRVACLTVFLVSLAFGCRSAEDYRDAADRQVYALIDDRLGRFIEDPQFTIEPNPDSLRQQILRGEWAGSAPLDLVECLDIAAGNNRNYQTQKEALYIVALALTRQMWNFQIQGFGNADAALAGISGTAETSSGGVSAGFTRALGTGANIVTSAGLSLFKIVTGSGGATSVMSDLSFSITQPLMRGFGRRIATENLTQAERDLVYQTRAFERFRRTFALTVASEFYDVLESYIRLENERRNLDRLTELRRRNEAWAEAGRLSDIEVDQARQDEIASESNILLQEVALQRRLDDFKFFLGLPIEIDLQLDSGILTETVEEVEDMLRLQPALAVDFALEHRLDYFTVLDELDDRKRKVMIAENDLRAAVDLEASVSNKTAEGNVFDRDLDLTTWSIGAIVDLPIANLPERNAYRTSLINVQVQERNVGEETDRITADVRDALRTVRAALETYEIERGAVDLARRRVRSSELSLEAGRADTRDVLESQRALLASQNSLTRAQIAYLLAQLQLLLDLELLRVDEQGIGVDADGVGLLLQERT